MSQPQKPPDDEDDCDALGDGVGVTGVVGLAGTPLLPAAALFDAEAGAEDGGPDFPAVPPCGALLGLALACGVAVAERDADAEAEGLALPVVGVAVPQTAVGKGSGFELPAALAGVARASAPATATSATGAPTAATARFDGPSGLRAFSGTGVLHFRKVGRRHLVWSGYFWRCFELEW